MRPLPALGHSAKKKYSNINYLTNAHVIRTLMSVHWSLSLSGSTYNYATDTGWGPWYGSVRPSNLRNSYISVYIIHCSPPLSFHYVVSNKQERTELSSVACMALPCFSTLTHKQHDLGGGGGALNLKCVFWFSTFLSATFPILSRFQQDITNARVHTYTRKILAILVTF